MAVDVLRLTC